MILVTKVFSTREPALWQTHGQKAIFMVEVVNKTCFFPSDNGNHILPYFTREETTISDILECFE